MENQSKDTMDRRCRRTKQAITTAMLELIREKPYQSITVSELSERADINRKTFYKHYHDTLSVLDEIEDELLGKIFANLNRDNILLEIENPGPFLSQVGRELQIDGERVRILIHAGEQARLSQKMDQIVSWMLDSFLEHNDEVDPDVFRFFMTFLAAGMRTIYLELLMGETPLPIERYNEMLATLIGHAGQMLK